MTILLIIVAIVLPPLAVAVKEQLGAQFWINLALTLIGWLPGVIHALYIVLRRDYETGAYERARESGARRAA